MIEHDPHIRQTAFVPVCEVRREEARDETDAGNLWIAGFEGDGEMLPAEVRNKLGF